VAIKDGHSGASLELEAMEVVVTAERWPPAVQGSLGVGREMSGEALP